MSKITVIGSLNMDLAVTTPRVPALGETILGSGFMAAPGERGESGRSGGKAGRAGIHGRLCG